MSVIQATLVSDRLLELRFVAEAEQFAFLLVSSPSVQSILLPLAVHGSGFIFIAVPDKIISIFEKCS
jgi:hypothetical protein